MTTVQDIISLVDKKAPFSLQLGFDNSGFLIGRAGSEVTKILVSLDITQEVVEEACQLGAQLIVAHHPIIFKPVKSITDGDPTGLTLLSMIEKGIAGLCVHTNLDAVAHGVNDVLAQQLGLTEIDQLSPMGVDALDQPYGIGRVGTLPNPITDCVTFAAQVKSALGSHGVRYVDGGKPISKVAVGGGACADMIGDAIAKGCDTFVTSDVKYNGFLDAKDLGVNLIDAGHYPTEQVIVPVLCQWLKEGFPEIDVVQTTKHEEVFYYV